MDWSKEDSMTLGSTIALMLTALLGLHGAQAVELHAAFVNGVVAVTSLVGAGAVLWKYLHGVHGIKLAQISTVVQQILQAAREAKAAANEPAHEPEPPPPDGHTIVHLP